MGAIIVVNTHTISSEHICCAISDKKCVQSYQVKKDWLKRKFNKGYVFRRLDERAKVFIEYGPAENACAILASKGAVHWFTRNLAAEYAKDNIRVNTIAPGIIRTPLITKNSVGNPNSLAGLHLLNRIGEVEEVAETVYYLASAKFLTGETINVAGGRTVGTLHSIG